MRIKLEQNPLVLAKSTRATWQAEAALHGIDATTSDQMFERLRKLATTSRDAMARLVQVVRDPSVKLKLSPGAKRQVDIYEQRIAAGPSPLAFRRQQRETKGRPKDATYSMGAQREPCGPGEVARYDRSLVNRRVEVSAKLVGVGADDMWHQGVIQSYMPRVTPHPVFEIKFDAQRLQKTRVEVRSFPRTDVLFLPMGKGADGASAGLLSRTLPSLCNEPAAVWLAFQKQEEPIASSSSAHRPPLPPLDPLSAHDAKVRPVVRSPPPWAGPSLPRIASRHARPACYSRCVSVSVPESPALPLVTHGAESSRRTVRESPKRRLPHPPL